MADKLNVLLLMTDQQRFDAMSCAGNTVLETPNMDRIAREGVMNSLKHANAANMWLNVRLDGDLVELVLRDDGAGFDSDLPGPEGHYGLTMMRERGHTNLHVGSDLGVVDEQLTPGAMARLWASGTTRRAG